MGSLTSTPNKEHTKETNLESDLYSHLSDIRSTLYFGDWIEYYPEIKVSVGFFEYECYQLDIVTKSYYRTDHDWVHRLTLSSCLNFDQIRHLPLVGGKTIEEYIELGFRALDYLLRLSRYPFLTAFLDNPGLLTLLLNEPKFLISSNVNHLKRKQILSNLLDYDKFSHKHLRWLAKVYPGRQTVQSLSELIRRTLLWETSDSLHSKNVHRKKYLNKLLTHQKKWLFSGLKLMARLILDVHLEISQYTHALNALNTISHGKNLNDNHANDYHAKLSDVIDLLGDCIYLEELPSQFFEKLKRFRTDPSDARLTLLNKLCEMIVIPPDENSVFTLLSCIFEKCDIDQPILSSNNHIKHLNTPEKLQKHAAKQNNCVWSKHILVNIFNREIDIYEMKGRKLITLSICRKKLSINQIQVGKGIDLGLSDLKIIVDWYESELRKIGNKAIEPAISTMRLPHLIKTDRLQPNV